jgi:hypothetical protein
MHNCIHIGAMPIDPVMEADTRANRPIARDLNSLEVKGDYIFKLHLFKTLVQHVGPVLVASGHTYGHMPPDDTAQSMRTECFASSEHFFTLN